MPGADDRPLLRIGELSRRVGLSDHVLRAWETRYGLLRPGRSDGGFRLYSRADEARVRRMQAHLADGLSPAEAARAALAESVEEPPADPVAGGSAPIIVNLATALRDAFDGYDEPAAQAVIDRLLSDLALPTVLRSVVLPYLAELGDRWASGTASVAQEHFASTLLRGRLAGLARGWGSGSGPLALLACPLGELHDLALMAFGLVLNHGGWRIHYLGTATPVGELLRSVEQLRYDLVVVAATMPGTFEPLRAQLRELAGAAPLALAGADASEAVAADIGAQVLSGDPVSEAERLWSARMTGR